MDNIQKNKKIFMMLNLMLILGLVMSAICYAELGSLEIKSVTSMFFCAFRNRKFNLFNYNEIKHQI